MGSAAKTLLQLQPGDNSVLILLASAAAGAGKVEEALGLTNLYDEVQQNLVHQLSVALKAKELYKRDKDYIVANGEVKIVDEFTGRVLEGRRWSEGIHQAVEAKEGVKIKEENQTLATVTLQNYFRMYDKLAGMTGTAKTEESEFQKIYGLGVLPIETNKPMIRVDQKDLIYRTEAAKFAAVVDDVAERHEKGQPILIGTASVAKSEILSKLLKKAGVKHEVLNAKNHAREAAIIALALKWCEDNLPATTPPRLVHGDLRMGNVMVAPDGLAVVLDWELAHWGDAHEDLAYGCMTVWRFGHIDKPAFGCADLESYFTAYEAAGGGPVDRARFRFWLVYRTLWWALGCLQMGQAWRNGADTTVERVVVGRRTAEQELDLLALLESEAPEVERTRPLPPSPPAVTAPVGEPTNREIVQAVRDWLDEAVKPGTEGHAKFEAVVAMNALGIVMHPQVRIGRRCRVYHHVTLAGETWIGSPHFITLEDDVTIGAHSIIVARPNSSLTIGQRSTLGAGSVLTKSIPPFEIWAGNPARGGGVGPGFAADGAQQLGQRGGRREPRTPRTTAFVRGAGRLPRTGDSESPPSGRRTSKQRSCAPG